MWCVQTFQKYAFFGTITNLNIIFLQFTTGNEKKESKVKFNFPLICKKKTEGMTFDSWSLNKKMKKCSFFQLCVCTLYLVQLYFRKLITLILLVTTRVELLPKICL
jgi:hypothetical protein